MKVLETALNEELTEHLRHRMPGRADPQAGSIRNSSRPKTVHTQSSGEVQVEVSGDRAGTSDGFAACTDHGRRPG